MVFLLSLRGKRKVGPKFLCCFWVKLWIELSNKMILVISDYLLSPFPKSIAHMDVIHFPCIILNNLLKFGCQTSVFCSIFLMHFDTARDSLHHQKLTLKQRFDCKWFTWEVRGRHQEGSGEETEGRTAVKASLSYGHRRGQREHRPAGRTLGVCVEHTSQFSHMGMRELSCLNSSSPQSQGRLPGQEGHVSDPAHLPCGTAGKAAGSQVHPAGERSSRDRWEWASRGMDCMLTACIIRHLENYCGVTVIIRW